MIVRKLHVQNIRSHLNSEVEFDDGFNCVVGGVGTGKTSLLLSLHFALFGEPLHKSYDYLLREDKNVGRISLEFNHAGKEYSVTRALRRERGRIIQDTGELYLLENGERVAWGKIAAVQEHVKALTGIDRKMFEEFIWIQQEKLKDILNMPPSERQRILDEFFGLSSFQKGRERLLPIQRDYDAVKRTLETDPDILGMSELSKQYDDVLSEFIRLQAELETLKVDLRGAEKDLKEADEKLQGLEILEKRIGGLREEKSSLLARVGEIRAYLERLRTQVKNKTDELNRRRGILEQLEDSRGKILGSLLETGITSPPVTVEKLKDLVESLDAKIVELRGGLAGAEANMARTKLSVETIQNESICPTCRREIDMSYRRQLISQLEKERSDSQQRAVSLTDMLNKLKLQKKSISQAKDQLEILNTQTREAQSYVVDREKEILELAAEISEKEDILHRELESRLNEVEGEISSYRAEDIEKMRSTREELFSKYKGLVYSVGFQERMIKEKGATLDLLEGRTRNAEEKLTQKKKAETVAAIITDIRLVYGDVVPQLRKAYVEGLRQAVQSVVDTLTAEAGRSFYVDFDEEYTPTVMEDSGFKRDLTLLSGGERTWLALAYRIGLGQLITEARTGQSLELLILDEPTESLGGEDRSIDALASALSNLKSVRQIITVTHSEELAKEAATRIVVVREGDVSKIETGESMFFKG